MKILLITVAGLLLAGCAQTGTEKYAKNLGGKCDVPQYYDIDFSRFDETAQQIAHATGCGITTDTSLTGAIKPHPVKGYLTRREAVFMAIQGTSLKVTKQEADTVSVE
ncbi:putative lipoprotein [Pectobacterium atrosepticum SCRI1043]|uniref:Lipoprotein n=1 Tax=Pectobacterium atrosepticum (strain SCRI 1043 / ATCC BAA-672) TaxID=218491 RepID=Q6D957_PECAS|nr:hypothetical protein [Pectobacterium atrosepticum]GKV85597.1 hypothetical protein PEC301296_19090 [Pectobacterium carotovorum subsp. carotovorum]AIA69638.1 hypothetical protein EV46_03330 [Pectobacterium atrosepticum]AIK12543.1 putative lipoprotein [Pectobacterium atrosepticum]ATY89562.1 hypothetical protein CVS35_03900 [Pectobacterium atrosepticum]KFX11772.1 hypothetical protein JV34_20175 [Pectobacterium atrosepticum]